MNNKKVLMLAVFIAMLLSLAGVTGYYMYMQAHYVRTDDARVDGAIVKISPQISGKISDMFVEEGQYVQEGATVARQVDFTLSPGANLDLAIIKSPVSGTVIKKIGNAGEVGVPGQPVVTVVDLKGLYITADVEETDLHKVKAGQFVEFTVDAFPNVNFTGQVSSLGDATVSTFSLLPTQNTGGNFTKVVQRIPVKISIKDTQGCRLLPGMNAIVKIHIKQG